MRVVRFLRHRALTLGCTALGFLGGAACHDDEGAASTGEVPMPQVMEQEVAPAVACSALTTEAFGLANLKITSAASQPGAVGHCRVAGTIGERKGVDGKSYAIGFEIRMPDVWNARFFFQGGGGTDGMLMPATGTLSDGRQALALGYAVTSTDGGHLAELLPPFVGGALFGLDPQARVDYGYNAVGTLTPIAKQIVARYYARTPARSYFVGCSNGGRQALVAAARFADQFDGILAGAPGFNLPKAALQHAWDTQQLLSVSPSRVAGAFTTSEMSAVGAAILAKCDALDGAADGMVTDHAACAGAFELARDVPTCAGERTGACLTEAQKRALGNIISGPKNSKGEALYSDWLWDPGIAAAASGAASWRAWKLENAMLGGVSFIASLGGAALPYIFVTPPVDVTRDPLRVIPALQDYLAKFDWDVDAPKIGQTSGPFSESSLSFMTPPNPTKLDALKARGKLVVYHGAADGVFSAKDTIRWYDELRRDTPGASDFARLFVVPGMGHCGGGVALDSFDLLTPLVDWVERGKAPETATARRGQSTNVDVPASWSKQRTRPLCAYPKRAVLTKGATDLESAESFHCE
ncbi:MAG: tannase/feruloyl esterase family alpha/beta hydrolase [Polyangiales bacterium]